MARSLGIHHPDLASARELRQKKGRDAQRRFLVEGETMLGEALAASASVVAVYATEEAFERSTMLRERVDLDARIVASAAIERLSSLDSPPGIVAVVEQRLASPQEVAFHDRLLLLAGLNDPGNAGTLLRTAEAFGLRGVMLLAGGVDPHSPKVVRASMGAIFRLDVAIAEPGDLQQHLATHALVGTASEGESVDDYVFPPRCAVAIGHERRGLASGLPPLAGTVAIPQTGSAESLNAAVAGGIILYCLARQDRLSRLG